MTQPPPPGYDAPYGPPLREHPQSTQLLVLSILSLLCCAPIAIYTLIQSNSILQSPSGYNVSKISVCKVLSIVALALWLVGIVISVLVNLSGMSG